MFVSALLMAALAFISPPIGVRFEEDAARLLGREFVFERPPFDSCHSPTIVELSRGELMAAWFGGSGEGNPDVEIWLSVRRNGRWTEPQSAADGRQDDAVRFPCWNPVLFKSGRGNVFLFFKIGPSPETWWGLMKVSRDEGQTWTAPERLPEGFLGPIKNKPVQRGDGTILCPSSVENGGIWRVHLEATADEGRTWRKIPLGSQKAFDLIQPAILTYPKGTLQVLCRSRQNAVISSWSADGGKTWGAFETTGLPNPNSGIDAVTLRDGRQVLVYNPTVRGEDWPAGRNKLSVTVSGDGRNWRDVYVLEDERSGEFSYPAIIQTSDGLIHLLYTWNRKNIRHVVLSI